jgi:hypothetical protein
MVSWADRLPMTLHGMPLMSTVFEPTGPKLDPVVAVREGFFHKM